MNMSSGDCFFGNITIGLASCAFVQFWNKFSIPTFVIEAAIPNSKTMDFQSGYEKGMLALSQALAGASVIWLHGTVYGELTAHPIQAILDDDIAGMVGRFLEGVDASKEALAIDLIEEVGTIPGFYLDKAHTRDWWRKEQYIPKAAELNNIQNWIKGGKKKAVDLAKSRMEEILANHTIKHSLTPSEEADIDRVIKDARVFYKDKMSS
jgi:trimethylamine--corrinoid protein Co-methyltransferase